MSEEWRDVPGWPYEISNHGRLRSVDRTITRGDGQVRRYRGREIRPGVMPTGHLTVVLSNAGTQRTIQIHRLVTEAFLGTCPDGLEVRHLDGNPQNNRLENLAYGTRSENKLDRVRHGVDHNARKTHCLRGHPFDEANTIMRREGGRKCRICKGISDRRSSRKKVTAGD